MAIHEQDLQALLLMYVFLIDFDILLNHLLMDGMHLLYVDVPQFSCEVVRTPHSQIHKTIHSPDPLSAFQNRHAYIFVYTAIMPQTLQFYQNEVQPPFAEIIH